MASLLSRSSLLFGRGGRTQMQGPLTPPTRGFHIDLGEREKALLADDPALKNFKSYKPTVRRIRKIGDALIVVATAACFYEIYQHGATRKAEHKHGHQY